MSPTAPFYAPLFAPFGRLCYEVADTITNVVIIFTRCAYAFLRFRFTNAAVRTVILRQLNVTLVSILPMVLITALITGLVIVKFMLSLTSLASFFGMGDLLVSTIAMKVAPFATTLILVVRTDSAMVADIAGMKLEKEFNTLGLFDIDRYDVVFLPRLLSVGLSAPILAFFFSMTALLGGYIILGYFNGLSFFNYRLMITNGITIERAGLFFCKPAIYSQFIALISIQRGLAVRSSFTEVPGLIISAALRSIVALIVLEVLFAFVT